MENEQLNINLQKIFKDVRICNSAPFKIQDVQYYGCLLKTAESLVNELSQNIFSEAKRVLERWKNCSVVDDFDSVDSLKKMIVLRDGLLQNKSIKELEDYKSELALFVSKKTKQLNRIENHLRGGLLFAAPEDIEALNNILELKMILTLSPYNSVQANMEMNNGKEEKE